MAIIGEIAVGIIVGFVSAIVSTYLALRRYRSERWWDKKYDAYIAILDSLNSLLQNSEAYYEELISGRETPDDEQKERNHRYKDAINQIDRHITLGTFLLRHDAVDALRELKTGLEAAKQADGFVDYLEASELAYRAALEKIREAGKAELANAPAKTKV